MLEVLVTVVILAVGLLGLSALQSRLQVAEMESYQRAQALMLLDDMVSRITVNRAQATQYVTATDEPLGVGHQCRIDASGPLHERDQCEWSTLLQGAAELSGANKVGAMLGGRGCVESLGNQEYLITVAWQAMTPSSASLASLSCGQNLYDGGANSTCTNDRCRRAVSTIVRIGTLS